MLLNNYQQALKEEKEEIVTSKSKALRKKRSARELEVDEKISQLQKAEETIPREQLLAMFAV